MLQLLYLDVPKVDQVLHLPYPPSAATSRSILLLALAGHPYDAMAGSLRTPPPLFARAARAPRGACKRSAAHGCLSGRPDASTTESNTI